jgi:hypothetical protein
MAAFCRNCGFSLGAGGTFCPQCGTQQTGPVNAGAAPAPPPPVPTAKSSTGLKIFLVVLVVLAVGLVGVVGGLYYVGHRLKQAVVARAERYGVDLHHTDSDSSSAALAKAYRVCDLLSKEDAAKLLGEPIDHTENRDSACLYYGPPGLSTKLAKEGFSNTTDRAGKPGGTVSAGEMADSVNKLVNSLAADAGKGPDGANELPLLNLMLAPTDGKTRMTALRMTKRVFGGIPGVAADIPDLGDSAVQLGNLGLNVLKGNALIQVIAGPVPQANEKQILVAREVLPRI